MDQNRTDSLLCTFGYIHHFAPDHVHGILKKVNNCYSHMLRATQRIAPTTLVSSSLGSIIGQYKSMVTKGIRKMGKPDFKWQRGYYDHVILNSKELYTARTYIINNPKNAHDPN